MTNIWNFTDTCEISNVINRRRHILLTHFYEAEFPVFLISIGVKLDMISSIFGSSMISKPNIIASVNELESWSNVCIVHDPAVCWVSDAMLQEDDWGAFFGFLFWGDSEHVKDVAVLSSNRMRLKTEPILSNDLLEGLVNIWADRLEFSFNIRCLNHQFIVIIPL